MKTIKGVSIEKAKKFCEKQRFSPEFVEHCFFGIPEHEKCDMIVENSSFEFKKGDECLIIGDVAVKTKICGEKIK